MKAYLYDFDGTIYDGDSSVDFFKYCLKKNKKIIKIIPKMTLEFIKYKLRLIDDTTLKETIFSFVKYIKNIDELVLEFWKEHEKNLKDFYLNKDHSKDIIISASPIFLLAPICKKLKVKELIASSVDKKTGKFNKPNNRGEEKVKVLKEKYPDIIIMEMYSDSMHDKPLLDLAKKSYVVKKNNLYDYETYMPSLFKRVLNKFDDFYDQNPEVINYLIAGALTTIISIGSYAIFAKLLKIYYIISSILSWVLAVSFAYLINRSMVFRSKNTNKIKEFTMFIIGRLSTLLLELILMIILVKLLKLDDLLSKILIQIIILLSNYLISKFIVFKHKEEL